MFDICLCKKNAGMLFCILKLCVTARFYLRAGDTPPRYPSFNRTRMELKPMAARFKQAVRDDTFNRTRMELKQNEVKRLLADQKPFNRTRMELKPCRATNRKIYGHSCNLD